MTLINCEYQIGDYADSFRVGCILAINAAIMLEKEAVRREMEGATTATGDVVSSSALVVVDTRAEKAAELFEDVQPSESGIKTDAEALRLGFVSAQEVWGGTKPRIEGEECPE